MYKIIPTEIDLTRLYFSHYPDYSDRSRRWFPFKPPRGPSGNASVTVCRQVWNTHRDLRFQSSSPYILEPIDVVPERCMGLFRNNVLYNVL
ncbi:hypothetical protein Zmor_001954 [Zophobas morio]|uniref:Uncharacterized protein n=1 Tax=Zophobas morio TaxID=2755281 RepID=A0AA38MPP6_9CUCU|nr:hypothetical protein Zmor_001954 [Zophobas morio]